MANSHTPPVALITGAARRIGAEIARTLHATGMNIVLHYHHSQDDAARLQAEFNQRRANSAITVQGDLLLAASRAQLLDVTQNTWGRLDVLVNNASTFYATPVGQISEDDWDDLLGTNLKAPLFLSQAAVPALRKNRGCIVNIVDIHAQTPMAEHPVYCAAKAGLAMLTRSLARELGPDIRVNGVSPGAILWPENQITAAEREQIIHTVPLKRTGGPKDIANAVHYLVTASYVNGQIIAVDGGRQVGWA